VSWISRLPDGRGDRGVAIGTGLAIAVGGVVVASLAVAALDPVTPVVALGVVYVLPVLLTSVVAGLTLGIVTAVLSTVAFNWFFLAPQGTLAISDGAHWIAIAVLLVVAIVGARITEQAHKGTDRAEAARRDASLMAELASVLLGAAPGTDVAAEASRRLGAHFGVEARVTRGSMTPGSGSPLPLEGPQGRVGWLTLGSGLPPRALQAVRERIAPALGALLAAAEERERHARGEIETAAIRRSDELKTTLLRSVSHDLRTPLTQMSASASALAAPSLDEADRQALAAGIVDGSERLAAMVEKLLDLARIEGGSAAPQASVIALDDVVRDAIDEAGARVGLEVQSPVPEVRADPVQLTRALVNVIENARVHGRGPGPDGDLILVRVARRDGRGVVRVVDRGAGVPDHARERVFAPFERGEARTGNGAGLGLAIARGFVEANHGRVRIESYPGQGTAVVVELPLVDPDPSVTDGPETPETPSPEAGA